MDLQRPPTSAAEIGALPAFGTDECAIYIRDSVDEFEAETLVYLLRKAIEVCETSLVELCGRTLIGYRHEKTGRWLDGHCEGIILTVARDHGLTDNETDLQDFRRDAHAEMWKAIYAGQSEQPYWEERFGRALKDKCIDVARRYRRHRDRGKKGITHTEDPDVDPPDPVVVEDDVFARIGVEHLLGVIRDLPTRQARAAFLVWVEGRPKQGNAGHSASEIMEVSPRAVYKLLEKARTRVANHPRVRPMLEDR